MSEAASALRLICASTLLLALASPAGADGHTETQRVRKRLKALEASTTRLTMSVEALQAENADLSAKLSKASLVRTGSVYLTPLESKTITVPIQFFEPGQGRFATPPTVQVMVSGVNSDGFIRAQQGKGQYAPTSVFAEVVKNSVTETGCTLEFKRWGKPDYINITGLQLSWIAVAPMGP